MPDNGKTTRRKRWYALSKIGTCAFFLKAFNRDDLQNILEVTDPADHDDIRALHFQSCAAVAKLEQKLKTALSSRRSST